jgi:hypothetical protein
MRLRFSALLFFASERSQLAGAGSNEIRSRMPVAAASRSSVRVDGFNLLFRAPDGAKPAGGNRRLEPLGDLAEQRRREKSVLEAPRLIRRYRAEIGAGPDEAVYLANHNP